MVGRLQHCRLCFAANNLYATDITNLRFLAMHTLCIDIGNTHTQYGLVSGQTVVLQEQLPTEYLDDPEVGLGIKLSASRWQAVGWSAISFCSVVPKAKEAIRAIAGQSMPCFELSARDCPGLKIAVSHPEEVGQDRLANAIGVQILQTLPSVVIDTGTAVTFDLVTDRGYEGGIIAPGLELMTRYLHEQTAQLPLLKEEEYQITQPIGQTTRQAMQLGCLVGFSGMIQALIEWMVDALKKQGRLAPSFIATGGSWKHITDLRLQSITYCPSLTLLGLAEAYRRQS